MAGAAHMAIRLLLFSLIRMGVGQEDVLILSDYKITFPCEDVVCFHMSEFSTNETNDYIAIISNEDIQSADSEDEDSKCSLEIKDLRVEDVGRRHCQQTPGVFSPDSDLSAIPVLNTKPGKSVSLQCVLLTYVEQKHCLSPGVSLVWVDEDGTEIEEDSQYQIRRTDTCDVTLTVTFQSPQTRTFRCQATVDEQVQTSVKLRVRVPGPKGRGRVLINEPEPEDQGGNDTIGAAVGVGACVVLAALVSMFVVNRRRTRTQLEFSHTTTNNDVMEEVDTIYADLRFPAGPDRVWVQECESTEYACVRYK